MKSREQILKELVFNSWWASWLPFGWMHNLAASYYARKARRLFKLQKENDKQIDKILIS